MKNKKIWARIGAVFACVLLVGALAIPCFAYYNPQQSDDSFISAVADSFLSAYSANMGYAGSALLPRSASPSEIRSFFSNSFLLCGYALKGDGTELYNPIPPASLYVDGAHADYSLTARMTVSIAYGLYDNMQSKIYSDVICGYMCSYSSEFGYMLELRLDMESGQDRIVYKSSDITRPYGSIALNQVVLDGVSVEPALLDLAFLLPDVTSSDMLGALQCMFFGDNGEKTLLFPNSYLDILANSEYVTDNYEEGYDTGYQYGYRVGYAEGENSTEAYERGYNRAVKDIDTGDFGRNFLGSLFKAPFDALRSFTLVEWTTDAGSRISISLATVFSALVGITLFIWFLKMFSGG